MTYKYDNSTIKGYTNTNNRISNQYYDRLIQRQNNRITVELQNNKLTE